jgi:serine/threonine protein kinase
MNAVVCGGVSYQLIHHLGAGEVSQVYLARRIGALPLLVTIKLSSSPKALMLYAHEAQALTELQLLDRNGAGAYFSRQLPEVIDHGVLEGTDGKQALVLHHPSGFWGSLAALNDRFASGIDPRHAVWIWRRMLEVLNFVHGHGWCHGDVRPEHCLVHPQDHGVRLIGWASAQKCANANDKAADLCRSARVVQVLLCGTNGPGNLPGTVPTGLGQLVTKAATDDDFIRSQSVERLDTLLQAEAKSAFGPPKFVPLMI